MRIAKYLTGYISKYISKLSLAVLLGSISFLGLAGAAERIDFEWVERLVRRLEPSSVEEVLENLPLEFRAEFTLVYRSRSSQSATLENPRALIYGPDARLVLAFNGDPSQDGYESLEMVQYRETTRSFEFRKIDFPFDPAKVIEKNPRECLTCHRADPRPNWDAYGEWPGVFGSADDMVFSADPKQRAEKEGLQKIIREHQSHPRYRHLIEVAKGYSGAEKDNVSFKKSRNAILTHHLAQLNFERLARILQSTANYREFKWAALGLLGCGKKSLEKFIPIEGKLLADVKRYMAAEEVRDPPQYRVTHFLSIFEARGIRTRDWFMSFDSRNRSFGTPGRPLEEMMAALFLGDSDLRPYLELRESPQAPYDYQGARANLKNPLQDCATLQAKSRVAIRSYEKRTAVAASGAQNSGQFLRSKF